MLIPIWRFYWPLDPATWLPVQTCSVVRVLAALFGQFAIAEESGNHMCTSYLVQLGPARSSRSTLWKASINMSVQVTAPSASVPQDTLATPSSAAMLTPAPRWIVDNLLVPKYKQHDIIIDNTLWYILGPMRCERWLHLHRQQSSVQVQTGIRGKTSLGHIITIFVHCWMMTYVYV